MSKQKTLNRPPIQEGDYDGDIYPVWSMDESLLAWNEPAIDGKATIAYNSHWGEDVEPRQVENPTYCELFVIARDLIRESGDSHHIFIEDFEYSERTGMWELFTGS